MMPKKQIDGGDFFPKLISFLQGGIWSYGEIKGDRLWNFMEGTALP